MPIAPAPTEEIETSTRGKRRANCRQPQQAPIAHAVRVSRDMIRIHRGKNREGGQQQRESKRRGDEPIRRMAAGLPSQERKNSVTIVARHAAVGQPAGDPPVDGAVRP